jgi:hypothetical protein
MVPFLVMSTFRYGKAFLDFVPVVNYIEDLRLLVCLRNSFNFCDLCSQMTNVSSMYLSHLGGLHSAVSKANFLKCSMYIMLITGYRELPTSMPFSAERTYLQPESWQFSRICLTIP